MAVYYGTMNHCSLPGGQLSAEEFHHERADGSRLGAGRRFGAVR